MKESKIFSEQNLAEKVHYVYRVTIDEKYYIGKRTGFLNDLETGAYATSSKIIQEKLQNGHHFSKIKILQVFSSAKDALAFENKILTRLNAKTNKKFLNQSNGGGDFTLKQHTEETKDKMSKSRKEFYNTEQGIKTKENHSEFMKERYNPETEQGRKNLEERSQISKSTFDKNTEEGRKRRENHSEFMKENGKIIAQKGVETLIQNRKNASILGELMFDEAFIRENFLITDDKNNLRFLSSVYSKLSGYCESNICKQKRNGKLSFLYGINSISISEEQENTKIKEIEEIIKSMNFT